MSYTEDSRSNIKVLWITEHTWHVLVLAFAHTVSTSCFLFVRFLSPSLSGCEWTCTHLSLISWSSDCFLVWSMYLEPFEKHGIASINFQYSQIDATKSITWHILEMEWKKNHAHFKAWSDLHVESNWFLQSQYRWHTHSLHTHAFNPKSKHLKISDCILNILKFAWKWKLPSKWAISRSTWKSLIHPFWKRNQSNCSSEWNWLKWSVLHLNSGANSICATFDVLVIIFIFRCRFCCGCRCFCCCSWR